MLAETIYIFGDSVSRGIVLDEHNRYSPIRESFGALAASKLGLTLVNKARFGCTIARGTEIVKNFLAGLCPKKSEQSQIALLEFGGNDCDFRWDQIAANPAAPHGPATPRALFAHEYDAMVKNLCASGMTPLLLTLPPLDAARYFDWCTRSGLDKQVILQWLGDVQFIYRWHESYNAIVWKTALDNRCQVIDIREAFLSQSHYSDYLCLDGIHPNPQGHKLIESSLLEYAASHALG